MQIRVGYELVYAFPQPTPIILALNIHYSRAADIVRPDHMISSPSIPLVSYRDIFGNWCNRVVAPQGRLRLSADGVVNDTGAPDVVSPLAEQHTIQALPEETLMFLLGSRYCETDLLSETAWKLFAGGGNNVRTVDLGVITPLGPNAEPKRYFSCVAGVGLDTATARIANQLPRWLRGNGGYALSLPVALAGFTPPQVDLRADGQPHSSVRRVLAAFANTPWYGGGMHIAPRADMTDGLLDACVVGTMSKAKLLRLFPSVYGGNHLKFAEVEYGQARSFELATRPPVDVYADGEFVCRTPVEIGVANGALRVIVPSLR